MNLIAPQFVDVEATSQLYRQFTPHPCQCAYCNNLRAQWPQWIAPWVDFLRTFGIDPDKPVEIVDFGRAENGRLYQVEWAFLAATDAVVSDPSTCTVGNAEIFFFPKGIPASCFDSTGRRW